MFIAKKENGELFSVAHEKDRGFLLQLRKDETFYCPCCAEKVILKLGTKRTYHFSHVHGSLCTAQTEPESEYHLSGKLQLYEWLQRQQLDPQLEPYEEKIKQRPDIRFVFERQTYVIEFQCSPISEQLFSKRTRRYLENGYRPIWILGASALTRKSSYLFSLSHFQSFFLRENNKNQWFLPTYCPNEKKFITLQQMIAISTQNIIAKVHVVKRDDLTLKGFLLQQIDPGQQITPMLTEWWKRLQTAKQMYPLHPGAYRDPLLKELYEEMLTLPQLPPAVGLPLSSSLHIQSSPLIWQAYMYIDNFHKIEAGALIYSKDVWNNLLKRVQKDQIIWRKPLFFKKGTDYDIIRAYLHLLTEVKILTQLDRDTFKLTGDFSCNQRGSDVFFRTHKSKLNEQFCLKE